MSEPTKLKRALSLPLLIFYGIGTILGLGIYILLGKVAGEAGILAPFSFLLAAVLAAFTGLSYGELSARIPKSAGEVHYVDKALRNKYISMTVGWLIVISAIISTATVVNGYVGYFQVIADIPDYLIIIGLTTLLGGIAVWGITESAATITIITLIEVTGIVLVIIISGDHLQEFPSRWKEFVPAFSFQDWEKALLGAFLAFFAFIGFEDMVNVAEEAKNPKKDLPKAIIISLLVLTILYMIVAVIASLSLDQQTLVESEAPLATILEQEGEQYPIIISVISLVAVVNGVLVQIIMGSRVLYGMAGKNMAPSIFGKVNSVTKTPIWSTIFATGIILILALFFELVELAKATNFVLIMVFIMVNLSLWVLKVRDPHPEGVVKYPLAIPVLGCILSLGILVFQVFTWLNSSTGAI